MLQKTKCLKFLWKTIAASICLFKVNHEYSRKKCEICSKLTIKTPERCQ